MTLKWLLLPVLAAAAIGLAGCASTANYTRAVQSWSGASSTQLLRTWGYPDRMTTLPNGHKLYVYRSVQRGRYPLMMTPGYTSIETHGDSTTVYTSPPMITGGGSYDLRCKTWFEVNRSGRVVNARFRGNNCVGTDDFVKQYSR